MRREAKNDTKQLLENFNVTISSLMSARRKEAVEMGRALALVQKQKDDAEAEAESSRQALERQTDELRRKETEMAEKDALIARYKAALGHDGTMT
jgi:septal ring factor EnvC (AmiA/AmiB activator)